MKQVFFDWLNIRRGRGLILDRKSPKSYNLSMTFYNFSIITLTWTIPHPKATIAATLLHQKMVNWTFFLLHHGGVYNDA